MDAASVFAEEIQTAVKNLTRDSLRGRFAEKIVASSRVPSKCEEFNCWHANSDNVTDSGSDLAWGQLASPKVR